MKTPEEMIREIFIEHRANLPEVLRWEDETDRLNELYFCLLLRVSGRNEVEVRNLVTCLAGLDLFEIESLAEAQIVGGKGGKGDKIVLLISDLLVQNGFEDKAAVCTLAICEVARGLSINYHGKLQKFLRKYANLMIEELDKAFSFSEVTKQDERYIFAHWLQNALEMPVPLSNEFTEHFCEVNGVKIDDLVEAADKVNLNVAVLDDLLKFHALEKSQ